MNQILRSTKGALLLACVLLGGAPMAWAQEPAPGTAAATPQDDGTAQPSAQNQLIERFSHEDAGSRVDELRVGGRTKSVTVTPKNAPAYEIIPDDPARSATGGSGDTNSTQAGRRVWKLGTF